MVQARKVRHKDIVLWAIPDLVSVSVNVLVAVHRYGAARFWYDATDH